MSNANRAALLDLLARLRGNRFRDLAGGRVTLHLPLSEPLVNELIAAALPPNAPVRNVTIRPGERDHFSVRLVPKMPLIPAIALQLAVDEQPRLPESAVLTLRLVTLGGLFGLASGAIAGFLPPGVRLDGERIHIDLRLMAAQHDAAELLDHLTRLEVHAQAGRIVLDCEALVG